MPPRDGLTSRPIRVLVAAPAAVARSGLEALLDGHAGLRVAGISAGGAALAADVERVQPDVVVVEMPSPDEIPAEGPPYVVLADAVEGWLDVVGHSVRAVLPRSAEAAEIAAAVVAVAAGLVAMPADNFTAGGRRARAPTASRSGEALTAREIQVLEMLAEGLGNKAIASRLDISEHTVKFHVGSIFSKLHASTRTEAVTAGVRMGLIML